MPDKLTYAPQPTTRRRLGVLWAMAAMAIVGAGLTSGRWWPVAACRVALIYWQHECMAWRPGSTPVTVVAGGYAASVRAIAPPWANLSRRMFMNGAQSDPSDGTLYLGERVSAVGHRRLVEVHSLVHSEQLDDTGKSYAPPLIRVWVEAHVVIPGTLFVDPKDVTQESYSSGWVFGLRPGDSMSPAMADPYDPSHFQSRCRSQYETVIIDGWLRDDESVDLGVRGYLPDGTPTFNLVTPSRMPVRTVAP